MRLAAATFALLAASSAPAQQAELEVVFFEVGTGDATLLISPTGQTMLLDGGPNRAGFEVILPYLAERDIQHLDYVCASHYHTDHVGGLDEIAKSGNVTIGEVIDRGDVDLPNLQPFHDYQSAMQGLRRDAVPGEILDLGGGVELKCLSSNGRLAGGAVIDLSGSAQQENSASISWLVRYGDFEMFVGGDLTGGSASSVNVERPVGVVCGDVDVYRVNMHGSALSSTQSLLRNLRPEFAIVSIGSPNGSNFPRADVIQRLSPPHRTIPVWSTTSGNGGYGFVDAGGTITLHTDGETYRATDAHGHSFTAWCDEVETRPYPQHGVVISEFHRDPYDVKDYNGEYIELMGTYPLAPFGLRDVRMIGGNGEEFTFGINLRLHQGETVVVAANGIPILNGGFTPTIAWPEGVIALDQGNTTIALVDEQGMVIDRVDYTNTWPGGAGVACERVDALGDSVEANFAAATVPYGNGDLGSPWSSNSQEITDWFPGGDSLLGHKTVPLLGQTYKLIAELPGEEGALFQAALSLGTVPGTNYFGTHIPINQDYVFAATRNTRGWKGQVPESERVELEIYVPSTASLAGTWLYGIVITAERNGTLRTWARPSAVPVLEY